MPPASRQELTIVPWPSQVAALEGGLVLGTATRILVDDAAPPAAAKAADFLRQTLGLAVDREPRIATATDSAITFQRPASEHGAEGYALTIEPGGVTIRASAPAGWFYAVQTLLQLLAPAPAGSLLTSAVGSSLPCVRIVDEPRFRWRGLMLDVVRHMMPLDGLLRLLDTMAAHKLNTFHWHLTDDQGWRIQSDRYPRLTGIGAWRRGEDGVLSIGTSPPARPAVGRYGGFYTHDDVRRVVAYAAERHIRVVPEIEMPGHATAALAAYPELSCTGEALETATRTGVFEDVYCAGNEGTLEFLQNVLAEIIPLFPGEYVHVGGDECPKVRWKACPKCQGRIRTEGLKDEHELQSYVIRRMEKFLAKLDRRLIGWDEILEGGLAPGATVMSWRGTEGGIAAARAGHDVVMTPHEHCYLDYRQAESGEPVAIGRRVTLLETTYAYEPVPSELTREQARHILGVQGNIWTEYMPDMQHVEYMTWPRAAAIAEVGWSQAGAKNFADFRRRVKANEARFASLGSAFRPIEKDSEQPY
jgi:hexosaminidase